MIRAIEFHPAAADEAVNAQGWYHEIEPKLGIDFKDEVERALERISVAPDRCARHLHETYGFLLKRFPYLIVYVHTESQIRVIAL